MTNRIQKGILAGIIATLIFSLFTMIIPFIGFPKMSPPAMLADMMKIPVVAAWVLHFMIGIVFAFLYIFIISKYLNKVNNSILKGVIFGILAFIIGQILIIVLGKLFYMPPSVDNIMFMMIGSILGHVVFGISIVLLIKNEMRQIE